MVRAHRIKGVDRVEAFRHLLITTPVFRSHHTGHGTDVIRPEQLEALLIIRTNPDFERFVHLENADIHLGRGITDVFIRKHLFDALLRVFPRIAHTCMTQLIACKRCFGWSDATRLGAVLGRTAGRSQNYTAASKRSPEMHSGLHSRLRFFYLVAWGSTSYGYELSRGCALYYGGVLQK